MKAWILPAFGLENLRLEDVPEPECGPSQVRVRLHAASLNYRDLLMVRGTYDPRQKLPLIPLSDGAGEVEAIGEGVTELAVGDRVCPLFAQGWIDGLPTRSVLRSTLGGPLPGTLGEKIVVRADGAQRLPPHLDYAEAATLPCAALTAWSALVTQGRLAAGQSLLVLGTGGVACFAIQFGKMLGARVIVTSRSAEKLARARELGADFGIDTSAEPAFGAKAREIAGGDGVDHVLELGGATIGESLRAVRPGGTISLIGILGGAEAKLNLNQILMRNVRVQGVFVGHARSFEAMSRAITEHGLRPVVDRVFGFERVPEAFARLEAGAHFGKICIAHPS